MIRYVETFFRYWLIVLIPIVALPAVEFLQVRHMPRLYYASTNIYVQTSPLDPSFDPSFDPSLPSWLTPAQREQANINQWLQSPSFCLSVAKGSPLYARALAQAADPLRTAGNDLSANVVVYPRGNNLLTIGYTAADPVLAMQVLTSVLARASASSQALKAQQADQAKRYYQYQLFQAQQQERDSAGKLADYMRQHDVTVDNLSVLLTSDPTLASLYQQNKNDHDAVVKLQAQLKSLVAQNSLPSGVVNQTGYIQMDPPSFVGVSNRKKILLDLGIALALGLLLACSFLVVMTALDRSVRRPEEVPQMLGLPVLAVVPYGAALPSRPLPASSAGRQGQVAQVKGAAR